MSNTSGLSNNFCNREEAKKESLSPFMADAKFVETDATIMRFDERNIADPLIGSVHDPIYQGAGSYGPAGAFVIRDNTLFRSTYIWHSLREEESSMFAKIKLQENEYVDVGLWDLTPFGVLEDLQDVRSFKMLDDFGITEADINELYDSIADRMEIAQRITHISNWLESIDSKRKKLEEKSFIDDL